MRQAWRAEREGGVGCRDADVCSVAAVDEMVVLARDPAFLEREHGFLPSSSAFGERCRYPTR